MILSERVKLEDLPSYELDIEMGIQKGILKGKIELLLEMGFSKEEIAKKLSISLNKAEELIKG